MQEMKELQQILRDTEDGTAQFAAEALESDIFEWQFAIRGPDGTDFEGASIMAGSYCLMTIHSSHLRSSCSHRCAQIGPIAYSD